MPSDSTIRPKIKYGGFAVYDSLTGISPKAIIAFQYNPDQIKRTLTSRAQPPKPSNTGGAKEDVLRSMRAPVETINITIALSAADQLEVAKDTDVVAEHGIYPVLSILEMLLYPTLTIENRTEGQAEIGKVQLDPKDTNLPLVLLVWGKSRVVPVQITSFVVTEEAFDENLNPIQAKVDLGLKVLTYMEFPFTSKNLAQKAFRAYQREKESLAGMYSANIDATKGIKLVLPK